MNQRVLLQNHPNQSKSNFLNLTYTLRLTGMKHSFWFLKTSSKNLFSMNMN